MGLTALLYTGILIVTGLIFGKIAKYVKLPNVTGYLVGGLIIGPSLIGIVGENELASLTIISNVALGFIAFSIGNEFKISYFKQVGPRPIIIAFVEAFFAVVFVFIAIIIYFIITRQLNITNFRFALVLSAIAAATAPAATFMVVKQYKAKGDLTDTLLSVVAIDDSAAIILFGLCVAAANILGKTDTGDTSLFMQILAPFWEIILSVGIGGVFGLIVTLAVRWFSGQGNRISLIIAAIFLTTYIVTKLNGSALMGCMALGAVFANTSIKYDEVNNLVNYITPPIFILFFVLSGAELNLSLLLIVGIIGLIYVISRVGGKVFGAWFGAKITKADPKIQKYLGFALIPQAGVAIGLSLIATQVLSPEMGSQIRTIILVATLIYELAGPVITKKTLQAAGEIQLHH